MSELEHDPIAGLVRDHDTILELLQALERLSGWGTRETWAQERWTHGLELVRRFADVAHHGKEEQVLFPAMHRAGMPMQAGPLAVMNLEHDRGRAHVRAMDRALAGWRAGNAGAADELLREAAGFVRLLREHIEKENHCLFPMARQAVTGAALEDVARACMAVEAEVLGPGGRAAVEAEVGQFAREVSAGPVSAGAR